jgi:adenine-specific DNA-methyltransferase
MDNFTELTQELNSILTKETKKEHGIFFTPKSYRTQLLDYLQELNINPKNILEPSFGSGEFIGDCITLFPEAQITGVELNNVLYTRVDKHFKDLNKTINLYNHDFLTFNTEEKFDLIIGNPPYVVMKMGTPDEFKSITTGRPNIYCWFIHKCIRMLTDNGILAFVIPNSILNTAYYELLRKFILQNCELLNIIQYDKKKSDFADTEQNTIALVLKRTDTLPTKQKYVVSHRGHTIFNINEEYLNKQLKSYPSMEDLGLAVKTGSIVWNEHKKDLRNQPDPAKLLIYTSNVKKGKFVPFEDGKNGKKQYIESTKAHITGPVILVNRGYGNVSYAMDVLFIEDTVNGQREFYVENHLNVIYPTTPESAKIIRLVYEYLKSDTNKNYISKFTGNGAMSKTELTTLLPICLPSTTDLPSG